MASGRGLTRKCSVSHAWQLDDSGFRKSQNRFCVVFVILLPGPRPVKCMLTEL